MEIRVTVKTGARNDECKELSSGKFAVSVREKPIDGKANEGVRRVLAAYFEVPPSAVRIMRGHRDSHKLVHIVA